MQATRARVLALAFAGLLALASGCGSAAESTGPGETPTASRTPTARDTTLLPPEPHPGFHIARGELASADENPRTFSEYGGRLLTLYGDPDLEDPATGPVLVAGRDWSEDWARLGCQTGRHDGCSLEARPCAVVLWRALGEVGEPDNG